MIYISNRPIIEIVKFNTRRIAENPWRSNFPPQKMGNERCNIQTGSLKTVAAETENTI